MSDDARDDEVEAEPAQQPRDPVGDVVPEPQEEEAHQHRDREREHDEPGRVFHW